MTGTEKIMFTAFKNQWLNCDLSDYKNLMATTPVTIKFHEEIEPSFKKTGSTAIPHIIKYMGSKKPILDFVISAIDQIHDNQNWVCDLFSGSCSISAAMRRKYNFISNDVQDYSRIIAHTYFSDLSKYDFTELQEQIEASVNNHYLWFKENYPSYFFDYSRITTLKEFEEIEKKQRQLLYDAAFDIDYHLFVKYYSGTYWCFVL